MLATDRKMLVVYIYGRKSHNEGSHASGFIVAPGRVLTAAHAVKGVSDIKIRLHDNLADHDFSIRTVLWEGNNSFDVAVLEFDQNNLKNNEAQQHCADLTKSIISLKQIEGKRWTSYGYPVFGCQTEPMTRNEIPDPIHWTGSAETLEPDDNFRKGIINLSVDDPPDNSDDWRRASGSGVFVDNQLCAVIIKKYDQARNKLITQTLAPLLTFSEFKKAICIPEENEVQQQVVQKIVAMVEKLLSNPQRRRLLEKYAGKLDLACDAHHIAKGLADLTIEKFLDISNDFHGDAFGETCQERNLELATWVEEVTEQLLPATIVSSGMASNFSNSTNLGAILVLPCATMSMAEIHVAMHETRKTKYCPESVKREKPYGIYRVATWPHIGFGEGNDYAIDTILEDLINMLPVDKDLIKMASKLDDIRRSKAREIDLVLDRRSKKSKDPVSYYFLFEAENQKNLAENLHVLLPHLRICQLNGERRPADESSIVDALLEYLGRARNRRNNQ